MPHTSLSDKGAPDECSGIRNIEKVSFRSAVREHFGNDGEIRAATSPLEEEAQPLFVLLLVGRMRGPQDEAERHILIPGLAQRGVYSL